MRIISSTALCFFTLFFHFPLSQSKIIPTTRRFPFSAIVKPESQLSDASTRSSKIYKTKYFTQILDHFNFNPLSYQKFQQRYLINDTFWGGAISNSPIFVYTGNEGDIEWFTQNTGFMFEIAPHFKALLVFIEHRFYGKSIPFGGDKKVAYKNSTTLGYLSSTQALADYATLILNLKQNISSTDSPVVVFGGSYGGMLAAWFRLKYPHIAIGALASSAPILNFENITSPYNFDNTVTQDFRSESENCYKVIQGSWQQIEDTILKPGGPELLRKSFRLCRNSSVGYLEGWLNEALTYTAMTDYPTPSNFLTSLPAYPVKQMCKAIDDPKTGNDTFAKLLGLASVYYNNSGTATCFNLGDDSDPHGLDEWQWQACTEMIMPMGSNKESIFGGPDSPWDYSARAAYCKRAYGVEPRPNWIATEFGGEHIEKVLKRFGSNLIFFNGLRDPWSGGGVLKNISNTIVAIVAEHGAHHVDLRYSTKEDPKWLQDVRKMEINIIDKWISQYHHDLALS